MKIFVVYGTRPELIKLAPLILALKKIDRVELTVISSGQHKEMLTSLEEIFDIEADVSFSIMAENQSINSVVSKIIDLMDGLINKLSPDLVFVQGDTATVLATAMACYYSKVKVAHIEAGLRSFNMNHPFPEEFNRRTVSIFADYNFAPTQLSMENLLNEGVPSEKVIVTGNTVIDALNILKERLGTRTTDKKIILVTAHRRENHESGIMSICEAIQEILNLRNDVSFIWPVHPNPNVKKVVKSQLSGLDNVQLLEPMDYIELLKTMQSSYLIWTDSGGIQEEAPTFKKPVLILREVTERPEVIDSGFGRLVGTKREAIVEETLKLLNDSAHYISSTSGKNPFGDGKAVDLILKHLELS